MFEKVSWLKCWLIFFILHVKNCLFFSHFGIVFYLHWVKNLFLLDFCLMSFLLLIEDLPEFLQENHFPDFWFPSFSYGFVDIFKINTFFHELSFWWCNFHWAWFQWLFLILRLIAAMINIWNQIWWWFLSRGVNQNFRWYDLDTWWQIHWFLLLFWTNWGDGLSWGYDSGPLV